MIQRIRNSRISKIISSYLALQMIISVAQPSNLYALTGGPSQPEFNSFTPIGTSDMVNLSSGDFNYNIPIMDIGGYPLNLAYNSGVTMDQEASWVGLGWNLNVGQINRQMRGIPDDFNGDLMTYENDMRQNITVGTNVGIQFALAGFPGDLGINASLGVQYNNYEGITFHPSYGVSFGISDNVSVGVNISSSTAGGATVSPSITFSGKKDNETKEHVTSMSGSVGVSMNSRKGLENLTLSSSVSRSDYEVNGENKIETSNDGSSTGGSISFNNNNVFTPVKRAGMVNGNFSFNAALGTEIFTVEIQGHIQGYGSYQQIRSDEKNKNIPSYGYNNTEFADKGNSVLDFNREKDRSFSKNTTVLPIANNTYDIYTMQGQGISGMFRPHRGQISYLMDNTVTDYGDGASVGLELGMGWNVHAGVDVKVSPSYSYTGGWQDGNFALNRFDESDTDINSLPYEGVYFKTVGELNVDPEPNLYNDRINANNPIRFSIGGNKYNRTLDSNFEAKEYGNNGVPNYNNVSIDSKIKRNERDKRNSAITTVTHLEANNDLLIKYRENPEFTNNLEKIKPHHTAGIKVLKADGSTYVYGETAYNWEKKEITVDVSGADGVDVPNCSTGLIGNNGLVDQGNKSDEFKNIITTPAYAHTFLLSSVFSADYEDISQDGPTIDDLGVYTLFKYGTKNNTNHYIENYNWRTPYENTKANYNEGLKSVNNDQKGSIIKGSKELRYIRTIETKTHVAYFKLSNRKDGKDSEGSLFTKKIDNIFLYSKPEFDAIVADLEVNQQTLEDLSVAELSENAIKTTHFVYDYNLCKNLPNNDGITSNLDTNELANQDGKLTLKEVYFTYRESNMGKYTPYFFNYEKLDSEENVINNPDYNIKGYDIWGNYKENLGIQNCNDLNSPLTTSEFPFVEQEKEVADLNSGAWTLTSIDLPSGGKLEIETEADDYQFVQKKKAMQMFEISGFGNGETLDFNDKLYNGGSHKKFIYVKISDQVLQAEGGGDYTGNHFSNDFLSENMHDPIYFRALLNMVKNTNWQYDYVSGYFEIDTTQNINIFDDGIRTYAAIPLVMLEAEGGWIPGGGDVNPIAKAGWYFGRTYLNRVVYSISGDNTNDDFGSIVKDLVSSLGAVFEIFTGPNIKLQEKQCARKIITDKSWVRLENPIGRKFGGGNRVKSIKLHDQWDLMNLDPATDGDQLYQQFYGQEYTYVLDDEKMTSSGVATYEPNSSKENPFVKPFYDNAGNSKDQLVAPRESNYVEKPIGESFFPSASVTYSRVEVKNLSRERDGQNETEYLKKHATGKVITEFYTSYDFPTITDYTDIIPHFDPPGTLGNLLNISVRNHLTFSQGFVVETNDMNGREKSQRVFAEGQEGFISGVDYKYNILDDKLSNSVITINKDGIVENNEVGLTYDVYNDFRENYSESTTVGIDFNVAAFVVFIFPVIIPLPIPAYSYHETQLRTASTTKVIHRTAILKEKIAYDLGSKVSTENIAWDAHTGQVILTETVNEYNDHYFNFTYPTHWYYKGMDMAAKNLGIEGVLGKEEDSHNYSINEVDLTEIFTLGDELVVYHSDDNHPLYQVTEKLWIASVSQNNISLMNQNGDLANDACEIDELQFKIVRSGYRNLQNSSMASVTSMLNPIDIDEDGYDPDGDGEMNFDHINQYTYLYLNAQEKDPKIVNASAVEYSDAWVMQWENNLPKFPGDLETVFESISYGNGIDPVEPFEYGFNPYLYNVRGQWRAKQSYAYLTGRISNANGESSPRFEGFFKQFNPFYKLTNTNNWQIGSTNWTSASQVTQYSPFGAELENKDALNRYSSAQYGYNYSLPVAVASNSEYKEMGFDGFEDYFYQSIDAVEDRHFGFFDPNNTATANLTETTSHTGRTSIAVTGEASFMRNYLDDGNYEVGYDGPDDCSDPSPTQCDSGIIYIVDKSSGLPCGQTIICSDNYNGDINNNDDVWFTGTSSGNSPIFDNIHKEDDNGSIRVGYTCSTNCGSLEIIDEFYVHFRIGGVHYFVYVQVDNNNC